MRLRQPVEAAPQRGKYDRVWKRLKALEKNGDKFRVLPVDCATKEEARRLYMAARTHRTMSLQAVVRGATVFINNK